MFARRTSWKLTANRFSEALGRARESGRAILDLTASNPTTSGVAYDPSLLQVLAQKESLTYAPEAKGLPAAREAVARYYEGRTIIADPRARAPAATQVVLTVSTSEAYSFAFRLLCDPGDEVLVASPSYPLFEFLADIQDVKLVSFPLFYDHGWHMDLHALSARITPRTRAILLVHPNNPTGSYVKAAEAERLNALCAQRGLALVVDEVFLDFSHADSAATFAGNTGALTFTLSGLSKIAGLPQMKLGWMVVSGPEELAREAMSRLEVISDTYLSVSTPVQWAAPELLESRHNFQRQLRERVRTNLAELDRQLAAHPRACRLEIEAGWYAVLRVPITRSDEELVIELLERGVEVHPGHFFDFPNDGYLVISLITPCEVFARGIAIVLSAV